MLASTDTIFHHVYPIKSVVNEKGVFLSDQYSCQECFNNPCFGPLADVMSMSFLLYRLTQ